MVEGTVELFEKIKNLSKINSLKNFEIELKSIEKLVIDLRIEAKIALRAQEQADRQPAALNQWQVGITQDNGEWCVFYGDSENNTAFRFGHKIDDAINFYEKITPGRLMPAKTVIQAMRLIDLTPELDVRVQPRPEFR